MLIMARTTAMNDYTYWRYDDDDDDDEELLLWDMVYQRKRLLLFPARINTESSQSLKPRDSGA